MPHARARVSWREYRNEGFVLFGGTLLFESDLDMHPAYDRIWLTVNDIGSEPKPLLFNQLDDGNYVRDRHSRVIGV